jgi:small subunit ribosomal protein S16
MGEGRPGSGLRSPARDGRATPRQEHSNTMAVRIRLMRMGMKKAPQYRVVVADSRSPRDGRFIENIGIYHPREEPSRVEIDTEKATAWLAKGAQPTEAVAKLLAIAGVEGMAERKAATKAFRAKQVQAKTEPAKAKPKPRAKK